MSVVIVPDKLLSGMDFSCIVLPKLFRPVWDKNITSTPVCCIVSLPTQPTPTTVSDKAIVAGESAPSVNYDTTLTKDNQFIIMGR